MTNAIKKINSHKNILSDISLVPYSPKMSISRILPGPHTHTPAHPPACFPRTFILVHRESSSSGREANPNPTSSTSVKEDNTYISEEVGTTCTFPSDGAGSCQVPHNLQEHRGNATSACCLLLRKNTSLSTHHSGRRSLLDNRVTRQALGVSVVATGGLAVIGDEKWP